MLQYFGYLSGILSTIGSLVYILDIFRGKTKPHRVTFLIYAVLGSISFFSQLAKGASYSLFLPGAITFGVVLIFLLSIPYGVGGFTKKDIFTLCFALLGLIAWHFTKEAAVALYIVILIDMAGTNLTIEKAYRYPKSETLSSWLLSSLAGYFSLLAVGRFNIVLMSYPLFIFIADAIVVIAIVLGKRKSKSK